MPDEEMKRDTCEMMRQCWYKDLRKPILDLPPGNMTHIYDSRIARISPGMDFMLTSIWILIKYFWVNQFNKRFLKTINIRSNSFIFTKNSFVVTYFIA